MFSMTYNPVVRHAKANAQIAYLVFADIAKILDVDMKDLIVSTKEKK
ncbi:hypothetical protein [Ostreibacterium oceani]|nr:hypothetical protein [Ostreibacterium oceani]